MGFECVTLFAFTVDGGVDEARGDGVDTYADRRQVPGYGEGHSDDATLGRRVGGLADLPVEGSNRGHVDHSSPLPVIVQRLGLGHRSSGPTEDVE